MYCASGLGGVARLRAVAGTHHLSGRPDRAAVGIARGALTCAGEQAVPEGPGLHDQHLDPEGPDLNGEAGLLCQIRPVGPTDGSLFGVGSILAIRIDVETEGGISGESLSVHPCQHWALSVDVIVDFDG